MFDEERSKHAGAACLIGAVLAFAFLAFRNLNCPGLSYDEVNWANVALGAKEDTWISARFFGFPWLLGLPYVGAFKGYVMQLVFGIFGISITSIRATGIGVGSLSLILVYVLVRRLSGGWKAPVAAVWLLALNLEFIQRMRQDLGPAAFDFAFKCAALLAVVEFGETRSMGSLVTAVLICAFGLWNKLTFVWYIAAFAFAFSIAYGPGYLASKTRFKWGKAIILAVAVSAFAYYALWIYLHFHLWDVSQGQDVTWAGRAAGFLRQMALEFGAVSSIDFSFGTVLPNGWFVWAAAKTGLILLGLGRMFMPSERRNSRIFFALSACTVSLMLGFTKAAVLPWNSFSIEPFAAILLLEGSILCGLRLAENRRYLAPAVLVLANCLQSAQILVHLDKVICAGRPSGTGLERSWMSMAIYPLAEFVRANPSSRFVMLDWGMRTQLMLLEKDPGQTVDHEAGVYLLPQLLSQPNTLFVVHTPVATVVPQGRDLLLRLAEERKLALRVIQTISDGAMPTIEIIRAEPNQH